VVTNATAYEGGGLVGESESGVAMDCYWDAFASNAANCTDSDNLGETLITDGCTAVNMANATPLCFFDPASAPLNQWDFTTVWAEVAADLPVLRDRPTL
jgi:hypothetical protein